MRVWSSDKFLPLLEDMPLVEYTECDMSAPEDVITQFYTDTFFIYFGYVAVIPTHLAWGLGSIVHMHLLLHSR